MKFGRKYLLMNKVEDGTTGGGGAPSDEELKDQEGQKPEGEEGAGEEAPKTVSMEEFEAMKSQLELANTELSAFRTEKTEAEKKAKEESTKKLKEEENWKQLYDMVLEENEAIKAEKVETEKKLIKEAKVNSFMDALNKKGLELADKKLLEFANIKDIVINPESGVIEDKSVDKVLESFISENKFAIKQKDVKKLPVGGVKTPKFNKDKKKIMSASELKEYTRKKLRGELE